MTRRRATFLTLYLVTALALSGISAWLDRHFQTENGLTQTFYRGAGLSQFSPSPTARFSNTPLFRRTARDIDLAFLAEDRDLPRRPFSVQWEGLWFLAQAETIDFYVGGDDRVVLRIDGRVVVERNPESGSTTASRSVPLAAGFHRLHVIYEQYGGPYHVSVQWAPAGGAPRPFDPEYLFPQLPDAREVRTNQRLHAFRRVVTAFWILPPLCVVFLLNARPLVRLATQTPRGRQWLFGSSIFLLAFAGYLLNTLHFEPLVFARQQNVIFSADSRTTVGSMSELTFREHIRQHPLFSIVTSSLVKLIRAVTPAGLNRAILATLALIGAANCLLAFLILRRLLTSTWLASWFAVLYGFLFCNLALFSIPETYSLSTTMVLVYLLVATAVPRPLATGHAIGLGLLAGLAGLFNPPLLSLLAIPLVLLLRDRPIARAATLGGISLLTAVLLYASVNALIYGAEFYVNYATDNERYGSLDHFNSLGTIGTVLAAFYLYSVISPLRHLTHDLTLTDAWGYFDSVSGVFLLAVYAPFLVFALTRVCRQRDPLTIGALVWLGTMTVFHIYFNPAGVMLYTVQILFLPLLIIAREFTRLSPTFHLKYVILGVFSLLMILRNVAALYAPVEVVALR